MKYRKAVGGVRILQYRDIFADGESIWCGHRDTLNRKRKVVCDWKSVYRTSYRKIARYGVKSWWGNEDT
jgi:hypothetical protein